MPYYCTVPQCTSMAGKAKNVSFHQFPRDEELATLWNKILKRGKPYTKYSKVCSLHFTPEDYIITNVGKNKGQWRTLRKDAIPSKNLPTDSPVPYQRQRTSSSLTASNTPSVMDPQAQQLAQAIYMQTMLAMQASGADAISDTKHNYSYNLPRLLEHLKDRDSPQDEEPHASNEPREIIEKTQHSETKSSYKCTECTKCFKDPDVFTLHQRTHKHGKENLNTNAEDTLKSNPILANLLRARSEESFELPSNVLSIESQIMLLAANMETYFKTLLQSQSLKNFVQPPDCDKHLNEPSESDGLVIDEDAESVS